MDAEIAQFANGENGQTDVRQTLARRCKGWMIDVISDVHRKQPVVRTIFKQISQGHRGMTEAMNKQSLQETFRVVYCPTNSGPATRRKTCSYFENQLLLNFS